MDRGTITDIHTVMPQDSVQSAAHLMELYRCRHLPIMEQGRLRGMISHSDIRCCRIKCKDLSSAQVKDYMTDEVISIDRNAGLSTAIDLMLSAKVRALVVKDRFQPVAIITETDLLDLMLLILYEPDKSAREILQQHGVSLHDLLAIDAAGQPQHIAG